MNKLQKASKVSKFLMATVGSTLFGSKPLKLPMYANSVADLEAYVDKLVEISRPPGRQPGLVERIYHD